ncbi:N-acetylmuramate alpha-1-phosphate uridylyltransferase MurU [Piscinibacter sp. XHJ-5]|uniref:N-acetylmuramate alpha-1-phosphate uridylyltransferase MurU n=1 Tax=Piscinibacter sp. XHJ-5 TaxID=3037797 RepID=UPI0024528E66|nr:nucleotidyltransferase family protein [Piscinibacter sp. XHJ-5]
MKAIILAAGRGDRMRPLTDRTPKPLLPVRGKPLLEWHLEALARAGVREVVINTAWLEQQIVDTLGDGSRWGVAIHYSMEGRDHGGALETAGGIAKALPLLTDGERDCFWVVSGDIFVPGFDFDAGVAARFAASDLLAHLWLVPNPPYHAKGDFGIDAEGYGVDGPGADGRRWTYANMALVRASLVTGISPGTKAALGPLLYAGMRKRRISVEVFEGEWENVGTPAQLAALNR